MWRKATTYCVNDAPSWQLYYNQKNSNRLRYNLFLKVKGKASLPIHQEKWKCNSQRFLSCKTYGWVYYQITPNSSEVAPWKEVTLTLDVYFAHIPPEIESALFRKGNFLIHIGGGITGDVQLNVTTYHKDSKASHRKKETQLMLDLLPENFDKTPQPSRDQMIQMSHNGTSVVPRTCTYSTWKPRHW